VESVVAVLVLVGIGALWVVFVMHRHRAAAQEQQRQLATAAEEQRQRVAAWEDRQRQRATAEAERRAAEAERQRQFAVRQRASQLSKWPRGIVLDDEIANIDGIDLQVIAQNERIESQVDSLRNLLNDRLGVLARATPATGSLGGDARDLNAYFESVFKPMQLPANVHEKTTLKYDFSGGQSRQLVIEYQLPAPDVVPTAKAFRYVKSQDRVIEVARPISQVKGLYANAIAQITLFCLEHIFKFDSEQHVDVIVFNGVVETVDPRTGKDIRPCLITVRTTRDTFSEINLELVDPAACLKHLNAGVSGSPAELAPVRPILDFSKVDPRFIAATDALGALDDRPNLMELTPQQFESLIQNLFEKIGLDTRQTRASRDGGVDCVAYNHDPILGGKVVIQAKRYKNTVGVSAVRDLYGTLQNEGASKGILVTTSGYGKASFDFAGGKPIELFDGANLLYLLETHAGIKARIEPPDDWQDPVPDSAETQD
jgi:HJR/Mrr/RecB family endonuclease